MSETFTWWRTELTYESGAYNDSRLNERAVEIPIAQLWKHGLEGDGFEVGNVLSHYESGGHPVFDRYEVSPGVVNCDVFSIDVQADWIIALSTIEHVRWDEPQRDPMGASRAIEHLLGLLRPGGEMLVSIPFGWHAPLDAQILADELGVTRQCTMVRDGDGWVQTPELEPRPYGLAGGSAWANSVWIGEWFGLD